MEANLILDFEYWQRFVIAWGSGIALCLMVRGFLHQPWHKAIGWGVMSIPLWFTTAGILDSISTLADPNSQLTAISKESLNRLWSQKVLRDIGYVGAGFLVWSSGGKWRDIISRPLHLVASKFPDKVPLRTSIIATAIIFPVFMFLTLLGDAGTSGLDSLRNGDESLVWANLTPFLAIMVSLSAGFGEEIVYRGVLLRGLQNRMPVVAAILLQGVFFGFAHAGYGTWIHVIGPALFGVVAAIMALRWGLWSAILLHVLTDLFVFLPLTAPVGPILLWLLFAGLLASLAWTLRFVVLKIREQRNRSNF